MGTIEVTVQEQFAAQQEIIAGLSKSLLDQQTVNVIITNRLNIAVAQLAQVALLQAEIEKLKAAQAVVDAGHNGVTEPGAILEPTSIRG